jgi:hypothetical protein
MSASFAEEVDDAPPTTEQTHQPIVADRTSRQAVVTVSSTPIPRQEETATTSSGRKKGEEEGAASDFDEEAPRIPPSLHSSLSSESLPVTEEGEETESAADVKEAINSRRPAEEAGSRDLDLSVLVPSEDGLLEGDASAVEAAVAEAGTKKKADGEGEEEEDEREEHFDSLDTLSSSVRVRSRRYFPSSSALREIRRGAFFLYLF